MYKNLLFLSLAVLCCMACEKEAVTETPQEPWVVPPTIEVSAAAGSATIQLREAVADAAVASDQNWCTASVEGEGTSIRVDYGQNDQNATRTALLTISDNGRALATVAVIQSRASIGLAAGAETILLPAAAEAVAVEVDCDVEYTASASADWLTLAVEGSTLVITPAQNPSAAPRKARVNLAVGEIAKSFAVEQEGAVLAFAASRIELTSLAVDDNFEVLANVGFTVQSSEEWLSADVVEGQLHLKASANSGETRSANLVLTAGELFKAVEVKQYCTYSSLCGLWTLTASAYDAQTQAVTTRSFTVTISEQSHGKAFDLDGIGTDYLAATTKAPVTLDFDEATSALSITTDERIGRLFFMGWPQDDGYAEVYTVYLAAETSGGKTVVTAYPDQAITINASLSADLNTIVFEKGKGFGFGMYNLSWDWTNSFCSYRLFDITLTRGAAAQSAAAYAAAGASNKFQR